jgi:chromosome segregation ATPase
MVMQNMSRESSPNIIEEIKKALEAATPGKWCVGPGSIYVPNEIPSQRKIIGVISKDADAELVANAPEWLSYLLTELEQEQAAHRITNDFFENLITRSSEVKESLLTELDAAKAEAERQKQIRYNATEANTINHSRQAEQIETLQQQLDAAKQENEELQHQLEEVTERSMKRKYEVEELNNKAKRLRDANDDMYENREKWRESHMRLEQENHSLQQQLKQAIEALEIVHGYLENESYITATDAAVEALSQIRGESNDT